MALGDHLATPLTALKTLLSESVHFRTLMGVAVVSDEWTLAQAKAAAEAKVSMGYGLDKNEFLKDSVADTEDQFPRTIIAIEDFSSDRQTVSSWTTEVSISLRIDALGPATEMTLPARYFNFLERVEGTVDDIRDAAADLTRINLQSVETAVAPQRLETRDQGNMPELWYAVLMLGVQT